MSANLDAIVHLHTLPKTLDSLTERILTAVEGLVVPSEDRKN